MSDAKGSSWFDRDLDRSTTWEARHDRRLAAHVHREESGAVSRGVADVGALDEADTVGQDLRVEADGLRKRVVVERQLVARRRPVVGAQACDVNVGSAVCRTRLVGQIPRDSRPRDVERVITGRGDRHVAEDVAVPLDVVRIGVQDLQALCDGAFWGLDDVAARKERVDDTVQSHRLAGCLAAEHLHVREEHLTKARTARGRIARPVEIDIAFKAVRAAADRAVLDVDAADTSSRGARGFQCRPREVAGLVEVDAVQTAAARAGAAVDEPDEIAVVAVVDRDLRVRPTATHRCGSVHDRVAAEIEIPGGGRVVAAGRDHDEPAVRQRVERGLDLFLGRSPAQPVQRVVAVLLRDELKLHAERISSRAGLAGHGLIAHKSIARPLALYFVKVLLCSGVADKLKKRPHALQLDKEIDG